MLALVDTHLKKLLEKKVIHHKDNLWLDKYVQPASIDLPIWSVVHHVNHKFIPFKDSVKNIIQGISTQTFDSTDWVVLYKGQTYLIPCLSIDLPDHLFWKVSPKSSLWRIDVLIRAVVDNTWIYDTVLPGTQWTLRLEVTPQSFNIKITAWTAITQLMIFEKTTEAQSYDKNEKFLFDDKTQLSPDYYQDHMMVSLWVGNFETIWYKARYTDEIIDLSKIWQYDSAQFFEPILAHWSKDSQKVILEKDRFYILPTKEKIRVPSHYSIELVPFTHLMGELRVHYAWFFDPWFGWEHGATWVLEVRPHEDCIVYDAQPICLMEVFTNKEIPSSLYWESGNNYQWQGGAKLAKYFK